MKKTNSRFYTEEKGRYDRKTEQWHAERLPDGRLYAQGIYPTKLTKDDLPEWYVYGRFYKRWGWLSTKGITDMLYRPSAYSNHFLKDDCLMLAYGGKISIKDGEEGERIYRDYEGVDEHIWGGDIITVLRGARDYSGWDITPFIKQLERKAAWLRERYPDEFSDFVFAPEEYGL